MSLLTKENFIVGNEIIIEEALWFEIQSKHTIDEICDFFHYLILEYKIGFPYVKISKNSLKSSFSELKNLDSYNLLKFEKWENARVQIDSSLKYLDQDIYIKKTYTGRPCSNFFFQEDRMKIRHGKHSPYSKWTSYSHRKMFKFLEHKKRVEQDALLACVTFNGGKATQFSTSTAKVIYDISQAKDVLDLCAGWGDRLVSALATSSVKSYTGIDPNIILHPKYEEISKFYKHDKILKFICSPAEDVVLDPKQFDVIFTSPPYFDLEVYSQDKNQSTSRYKTLNLWLNRFLFKLIELSYLWLKEDGRLFLNISDYNDVFFCQKMIDYALSIGFKYEGIIGYELTTRPGISLALNSISGEPIFVFVKGNPQHLILSNPNALF